MTRLPSWASLALVVTLTGLAQSQTAPQPVLLSLAVIDAAGWKISGASLSIGTTTALALTNGDGNAKFWLAPGSYDVSVNAAGFLSRTTHVDLKKATEQQIELTVGGSCPCVEIVNPAANLETSRVPSTELLPYAHVSTVNFQQQRLRQLTVKVIDQSGAVIPGAAIYTTDAATGQRAAAVTNEEGAAVMTLKPGTYQLAVQSIGFAESRKKIDFPKENLVNLTLMVGQGGCDSHLASLAARPLPLDFCRRCLIRRGSAATIATTDCAGHRSIRRCHTRGARRYHRLRRRAKNCGVR